MKRPGTVFAAFVFCFFCTLALFWFGSFFLNHLRPGIDLHVVAPEPRVLPLKTPVSFDLQGSGFDKETSVSLIMDVGNHDMIINRYPLDGYFNVSLIDGDLLFLGSNDGLRVVSLADPQSPRLIDTYLAGRSVISLHRAGDYLFVVCGRLGIVVMTLKDGILMYEADIWAGVLMTQCYYHQGFLYVATNTKGLLVYDLREHGIALVSRAAVDMAVTSIAFYDDILYLANRTDEIHIYDCSNPANPRRHNSIRLPEQVRSLLVMQQGLYVALRDSLRRYSLTAPLVPRLQEQWDGFGSLMRMVAGMEHLYLVDSYSGLRIVNMADHAISEQMEFASGLQTIAEGAVYLYTTGVQDGLLTVDKARLRSRQVARWANAPATIRSVYAAGEVFYIAGHKGVFVADKNNDKLPLQKISSGWSVFLEQEHHRNLLFVAQNDHGIKIFDVTEPRAPRLRALWPELTAGRLMAVDNLLLALSGRFGVHVIDISDIDSPQTVERLSDLHVLSGAVEGKTVFLVTRDHGLLIYDTGSADGFALLSRMLPPYPMDRFDELVDIDVRDGIAYLANGRSGLLLIDVRQPEHPRLLSSIALPGYSKGVRLHHQHAYVVSLRHGISVVDISSPERPRLTGTLRIGRITRYLLIVDDLLYFFQDQQGMAAIPLPLAAADVTVRSSRRMSVTLPSPEYPGRYSLQISNRNGLVVHYGVVEYH